MKAHIHPQEVGATNIDTDVIYRKWIPLILPSIVSAVVSINSRARQVAPSLLETGYGAVARLTRSGAPLGRGWSVARMMFVVIVLMCAVLVLNLLYS